MPKGAGDDLDARRGALGVSSEPAPVEAERVKLVQREKTEVRQDYVQRHGSLSLAQNEPIPAGCVGRRRIKTEGAPEVQRP